MLLFHFLNNDLGKQSNVSLLRTAITEVGEIRELIKPITDFDFIWIDFGVTGDNSAISVSTLWIPVAAFADQNYGKYIYSVGGNLDTRAAIVFTDATHISFAGKGNKEYIISIRGYKLFVN